MLSTTCKKLYFKKKITTCAISAAFQTRKVSYTTEPNVVRSKVPDIKIPNDFLEEYLWKNLDDWHDKTAFVCAETGRSYLFSEVHYKSKTLANFLHNLPNLKQNDTVAVILPNIPEYPIIMLGAIQAGLRVTPVNWVNTSDKIALQLLSSETKLVFTSTDLWLKVNQAIRKSNSNIPVIVVNHQQNQLTPPNAIKFNETVEGERELQFQILRGIDDVILLPYSRGTTGIPKGVELTNRNIVSNLHQMASSAFKLHSNTEGSNQEVVAAVLPWFHIYGLIMGMFNMLASGSKQITIPKFGSTIFLKVLDEHRPTFAYLVPPIISLLANNPEVRPEHISQMRTIVSTASPLGPAHLKRLHKKSREKVNILQAYGLTEASPITHAQTTKIANAIKLEGSGFALSNTECKIVAADDETKMGLGPNQPGELLVRGPQIMKGYYKNENATRAVLDSDGWLKTGDVAHYDKDGHFYITERLKELIKVKGLQVAPAELEELLRNHPDVEDAAVIGVPHEAFGEVPKAFIVPKKNITVSLSKVHKYMAAKAANYKQLVGGIVTVDSIPKSQSGKILRRQLKELQ